jgi:hypothetical protein
LGGNESHHGKIMRHPKKKNAGQKNPEISLFFQVFPPGTAR